MAYKGSDHFLVAYKGFSLSVIQIIPIFITKNSDCHCSNCHYRKVQIVQMNNLICHSEQCNGNWHLFRHSYCHLEQRKHLLIKLTFRLIHQNKENIVIHYSNWHYRHNTNYTDTIQICHVDNDSTGSTLEFLDGIQICHAQMANFYPKTKTFPNCRVPGVSST